MTTAKLTNQITIQHWTAVQMRMTAGAQFTDASPLDDVGGGGAGPFLVMERGIWKYPQQAVGGRFTIPRTTGKPVRLMGVMADFGIATAYSLSIRGIDNSLNRPDNTTGEPYDIADAPLYRELDIDISAGSARYLSLNFNTSANDRFAVLQPGQDLVLTTVAGSSPLVRFTFALATENC